MVVNLCAAHKKTDWRAAYKVLLACFLQLCSTRRWILCSAQNRTRMLYTEVNSHVTRQFGPNHSTKIQEHKHVAACECQLRREQYRIYCPNQIFFKCDLYNYSALSCYLYTTVLNNLYSETNGLYSTILVLLG